MEDPGIDLIWDFVTMSTPVIESPLGNVSPLIQIVKINNDNYSGNQGTNEVLLDFGFCL